jgi:hypothetical protein
MAATPSLDDLNDGRYLKEPKSTPKKRGWTLNSRYIVIHYFFNVLGEKRPRNLKKGTLPSIDAAALEKMANPVAGRLLEWRSALKAMQSIQNALTFVKSENAFAQGGPISPSGAKAVFRFVTTAHDNVERVFTQAKRSIPLNLDKSGRKAFIVPAYKVPTAAVTADPANAALVAHLLAASPAAVEQDDKKPFYFEDIASD